MSTVMIDFKDTVPVTDFGAGEPMRPGVYEARIIESEYGTSKAGNPKVVLTWQITEGEYAGRKVKYDNVAFGEKSAPFILGRMVALGLKRPAKPVAADALAKAFASDANGKIANITLGFRDGQDGKTYNEVVGIAPANFDDGGSAPPADEDLPVL